MAVRTACELLSIPCRIATLGCPCRLSDVHSPVTHRISGSGPRGVSIRFLGSKNRDHVLYIVCIHHKYIHRKKPFGYSRPQPGCHLPNSPWAGIITSNINYYRLGRVWSVTSRLGTGISKSFFYGVRLCIYAYSIVYLYTVYAIFCVTVSIILYLTEMCYIYTATVFMSLFAADVLQHC
jgi:hypothetical protein